MKYIILILIILLFIYFFFCYKYIEPFDESKIKIAEFAKNKIDEFNYDDYKKYIDKYFKNINPIDLNQITLKNDGKILCSVASYRDKQCPLTVADMINKATDPTRLVIVVCQQNDPSDTDCFSTHDLKGATVKKIILSDREARGPCWARYLIQQKWEGEEYFLQIDSHTRFVQNWDQLCIDQLAMLPEKSCLTNYVGLFNLDTGLPDSDHLRGPLKIVNKETSEHDGFFRVNSDFIKEKDAPDAPMLSYGWGACFSFSKSNLLQDAPYDPYTPFLFFGEEMDIWARMFTRGWYVYAPSVPICFTNFDRAYRPTFWENPDQSPCEYLCRLRLYYRFNYLDDIHIDLKVGMDIYGLGKDKTWNEFLTFCLDELER
jgi:[Skp1-protein]-hydroxyproline N-acetylglucosaminyltransferase